MNNLDFFKTQLEQIVALNEPDQIEAAVANFLAQRMPREQLVRQGLLDWAETDLAEQRALIASGLSNATRIAMLTRMTLEIKAYERLKRL
jgi:hypothetical protein